LDTADTLSRSPSDEAPAPRGAPVISDQTVHGLVAEVDRTGFAVLPHYLSPDALAELQRFVASAVETGGGEYKVFTGKEAVEGTLLAELAEDPAFQSLIRRIYEGAARRPAPDQSIYQVLRCLAGETGLKECFIFHYDSYVVTLLLPILIPSRGPRGDLVIAPNLRRIRKSYVRNLADKLLVDNGLTQRVLRALYRSGLLKLKQVEMNPGDLYIFWGYRTLHTNEPCDVESIRSTALYHFGDPHADDPLRRKMGRVAV
jgi:hypothetical protein